MTPRTLSLSVLLCALAVGCGGNGSSRSATTAAPVTTPPPPPPSANFQPVGFETVEVGAASLVQTAQETHVATDPDWASFWPTHSLASIPPTVDFSQESVVGTFMGQVGGGSHTTQVVNVSRDTNSDDLHAVVREFRLGPWRVNTANLTSPFHLVRCETAVSGQGALTVDRQTLLDFETVASGSNNAIGANDPTYTGGLSVYRDAASFNALFAQIQPAATPPTINFQTEMVVAVLGPYIGSFGNSVQTVRILHDPTTDELRIIHRVNPYRGGAAPPPATETPFQILRVTRATGTLRAEQVTSVTQTALANGQTALYTGPADTQVVRDAATFTALWTARVGGTPPVVDFTTDQVLFAFEPSATQLFVSVARSELLENDELSVTVNTLRFGATTNNAPYSMVTVPRTYGPVTFTTVNTTPAP